MKQTDMRQKRAYIEELVRDRGMAAIPVLVELLSHESWTLRESAAAALIRMGRAVLGAVLPLAREGLWYSRAGAARVLGAVGGCEGVVVLLSMVLEENRTVRSAAAEALAYACRRGGGPAVARGLHALSADQLESALAAIELAEGGWSEKLRRLLADTQLMGIADDDDSWNTEGARGSGLDWEVLMGGGKKDV